ncbi:hypothetical protein NNO04_14150 [Citrobacter sp. Awk 4]|uniref:hypothetical protein n=1 Tax=Citrobacter sp. Awk 4 TaxID=2963955 RepID=UPI0023047585|nr:hypothetical protein [Citrobacter sp. Awk 4]MDA8479838.1 hypothetical protein [Citrobacter sp. Awk 4]
MTTLTKDHNKHPAHAPLTSRRLHQIRETLSKAAAQRGGGDIGYAMSDAVKLIDEAIAAFGAEPVAYADPQAFINFQAGEAWREWMWRNPGEDLIPLYAVTPSPVVVPNEFERRREAIKQEMAPGARTTTHRFKV